MLWLLLTCLWILFATITATMLHLCQYQDHNVLGIVLAPTHAQSAAVQNIIKRYKQTVYLILCFFFVASFILFLSVLQSFATSILFVLTVLIFFAFWLNLYHWQKVLTNLKVTKAWTYPSTRKIVVDTAILREKFYAAASVNWLWFFLALSFIPLIVCLSAPEQRHTAMLASCLIIPLIQVLTFPLYRAVFKRHLPKREQDLEINKAYARHMERIGTVAIIASAGLLLVFSLLFFFFLFQMATNSLLIILPLFLFCFGLLAIALWQHKQEKKIGDYFYGSPVCGETDENIEVYEKPPLYKFGCYNNSDDPRLFVPKRLSGMGWSINLAHPAGKWILAASGLLIAVAVSLAISSELSSYKISITDSQVKISGWMYHSEYDPADVTSIEQSDQVTVLLRTNGVGAFKKSFGHFNTKQYGSVMMYIYNDIHNYIIIHLPERIIILNAESEAATDALYQKLKK